ncbi:Hypothetical predicted protein [Olea europaea subsp. europaea]|uniref:Uncharacterized protein n=1 Tax=Olea europaea subsp. europaea TaxID=158383 RepID=A0A8S0V4B8_OLEEU|nr:Hypothetical predicted protein [Olea europaea subsp. europaea]
MTKYKQTLLLVTECNLLQSKVTKSLFIIERASSADSDTSSDRVQSPAVKSEEISVYSRKKASIGNQKNEQANTVRTEPYPRSGSTSPLKEKSLNQTPNTVPALKPKHASSVSGEHRNRRRHLVRSNEVASHKRWV